LILIVAAMTCLLPLGAPDHLAHSYRPS